MSGQRCLQTLLLAALLVTAGRSAQAFEIRQTPQILPAQGTLEAVFSPWDDIEGLLLDVISKAREQLLLQAYMLTSKTLTTALIAAHQRGVDVRVLLDGARLGQSGRDCLAMLRSAGITVALETRYKNAHNKVIIIDAATDNATVITGSYNFTWSAQHSNAENVLIARRNAPLAAQYASNWMRHFKDAEAP